MSPRTAAIALALSTAPLVACDDDPVDAIPEEAPTIVEVARDAGTFTTLLTALEAADLDATLEGSGPFTVFAPTDEAFAKLPAAALDRLIQDPDLLTRVLSYHVVSGSVRAQDVAALTEAATLNGKAVQISVQNGTVMLDQATVVATDVEASNGVIHVIDNVLLPEPVLTLIETAERAGSFATLLAAIEAAGLTSVLQDGGPFTVFAPSDEAFARVPAADLEALLADPSALSDVLTYHVVPGKVLAAQVVNLMFAETVNGAPAPITVQNGTVRIDEAEVTATDIEAVNGVIHVIDAVLFPGS